MNDEHNIAEDAANLERAAGVGCGSGLLLTALAGLLVFWAWDHYQSKQVVARQALGPVLAASGAEGLRRSMVIETPQGFFPLLSPVALARGTELVLEERANGDRYICDVPRTGCVRSPRATLGRLTNRKQAP